MFTFNPLFLLFFTGKIVFAASYAIVTAIPRTDNIVYDITAQLYSLNAHGSDAGGNLELYGFKYSWPMITGESVKVAHFATESNYWLSPPETGYTLFSENSTTKR